MELTIDQAMQQGAMAHNQGKLQEAEKHYCAVIQSQPTHAEAHHNLGLIAVSVNNVDTAVALFKIALDAKPNIGQFWLSYINALIKNNQIETAKAVLKKGKNTGLFGNRFDELDKQLNAEYLEPPKLQLNRLLELYNEGLYDETEKLALSITQQYPENQFSWKVLGAILGDLGKQIEAIEANQKAIQLAPHDAECHNNLGNAFKAQGRLDEAEVSLRQAIDLKFGYAEAYNNLGSLLSSQGKLDEAEVNLKQAITIKPNYAQAHNNLGLTFKERGRLDEAEISLRQAIELKPNYSPTILSLAIVLTYMNKLEATIHSYQQVLQLEPDNLGLKAGVNLAIFTFLDGDFTQCKTYLLAASKIQEKSSLEFKNDKVFHNHLLTLLNWHDTKYFDHASLISNKSLYVIGESHSLASHFLQVQRFGNNYSGKALLIKGCKQWHLGNTSCNQYKIKYERLIGSIPKGSDILLAIGEIDCRLDSGIIKHQNKYPEKDINEIIVKTVDNYLNYVTTLNANFKHNVIIQGVPCPNINIINVPKKEVALLIEVLKTFNDLLRKKSKIKGFGFLDLHKLTDRGDGFSNTKWHTDTHHISPEGMLEAWRQYAS